VAYSNMGNVYFGKKIAIFNTSLADKLLKAGLYLSKCKEKWQRSVMKYEEE
jgi:hypothetical protein